MHTVTSDVRYVDLNYQGQPRLIATAVVNAPEGLVLVDPGPETAFGALTQALEQAGASLGDVHAVLLTHIHLDHAGATGRLVDEAPHVQVYVHERGARHLIHPARLLRSARRIYGDQMDRLWGTVQPVPEDRVTALAGGESIAPGGRAVEVAYTPGHAAHHVSYLDVATGTAFVGDVAGMRVPGADYVLPVAPPPDIDVPAWHDSLDVLRAWQPARLVLTHCGAFADVPRHLDALAERLDAMAEAVRSPLASDAEASAQADRFHERCLAAMREQVPAALWAPYERFGQPRESWHGLARYWRTRDERPS